MRRGFRQKNDNAGFELEIQSLLRYLQSLESKSYFDEQTETKRIQGLLDDPFVSESYKQSLSRHFNQKRENKVREKLQSH